MPAKISPSLRRSHSAPALRNPAPPKAKASPRAAETVFVNAGDSHARRQILRNLFNFLDCEYYHIASNYLGSSASLLTEEDLLCFEESVKSKFIKNNKTKILDWIDHYLIGQPPASAPSKLIELQDELSRQIGIKRMNQQTTIAQELKRASFLGDDAADFSEAFTIWLTGQNERELQQNLEHWRKFMTGCHAVKTFNEQALANEQALIPFQGMHPSTTKLFLGMTDALQNSHAMMQEPRHFSMMNALVTTCIDRVAPDLSSDVDSYVSLHEPDDGAASRVVYNVTDFARTIFNGPEDAQKWYLGIIQHGNQWHIRGSNASLKPSTILQSFEWRRGEDGSLLRKLAMTTYLSGDIKTRGLNLNIRAIFGRDIAGEKEIILLRLLKKLGNQFSEKRGQVFEHWLDGKDNATLNDDELRNFILTEPAYVANIKTALLDFLKQTDQTHAQFIYSLLENQK